MSQFELLGAPEDESRILCERLSGYWVTLAGHPSLTVVSGDSPRYDAVIRLADIGAEHGFRIDEVPSSMPAPALAAAFATAYAKTRAVGAPTILPIGKSILPTGTVAGAQAQYRIRDAEQGSAEQVWVVVRPAPDGYWVLYHTTRFNLSEVNTIKWTHLRATSIDQHRWEQPVADTVPVLWPTSSMGRASVKLDLTEEEWGEAQAKVEDIGTIDDDENRKLVEVLVSFARTDDPPRFLLPPALIQILTGQLQRTASGRIADVLLRNLDQCKSSLDLRAWCWECVWAIGNSRSAPTLS